MPTTPRTRKPRTAAKAEPATVVKAHPAALERAHAIVAGSKFYSAVTVESDGTVVVR